MNKLLLIDGSNLLFQMFFGMPDRMVNRSGKAVHGTVGFVGALLKIIRMTSPTHVTVLFDGEHQNDRALLAPEYKANRTDYNLVAEQDNPFSQLSDIYAALDHMNIKYAETTVCETDDWIAGYALTYGKEAEVVISSFDSDYFQLLTENVSILRYRGKKTTIFTPEYIVERFGVLPSQYADFKSLVGDPSDNIKGVEKVGQKTAARLLNKFSSLEGVIAGAAQIERSAIRQAIIDGADRLRTNYKLIKLSNGAALPFLLKELSCPNLRNETTGGVLRATALLP